MTGQIRKAGYFCVGAVLSVLLGTSPAPAAVPDLFGPPPAGDPSALTGHFVSFNFAKDLLATLPPTIKRSLEENFHDAVGANNAVPVGKLQPHATPILHSFLDSTNVYPESVAMDQSSGSFFVGSVKEDTIYKGNVGTFKLEVFSPGMKSEERGYWKDVGTIDFTTRQTWI